jgi:multiple sugar transport system ATP-binding protein
MGEIPLDEIGPEGQGVTERSGDDGRVVVGVRPEDFEDAAVAGNRGRGVRVTATVDVLESTGSDLYAHLSVPDGGLRAGDDLPEALREGVQAAEGDDGPPLSVGGPEVVARVDASSRLREGTEGELWLDSTRLHLFHPSSGERLAG